MNFSLRLSTVVLVSFTLLSTSSMALEFDGGSTKDLIPVVRPIASLVPKQKPKKNKPRKSQKQKVQYTTSNTDLVVTAWVDRESLTYKIGDTVRFSVQTNKDAYITILDIGTTGATTVIYPNNYQSSNSIKAGETLTIPQKGSDFEFEVTGQPGKEVVKVFATLSPEDVIPSQYLVNNGRFRSLANSKDITVVGTVANRISQRLNNPVFTKEWDEYTKILTIVK